jgi:uncharacterized protein involved in exopolysaccharide biosynthesis
MQEFEKIKIAPEDEEEIDPLHTLLVILKRKKMIVGITLGCALITVAISFMIPPKYKAETRILPPQQSCAGISGQIPSQVGDLAKGFDTMLGLKNPNEICVGILKGRTVYDRIIDEFGLMELYEAEYREDARDKLDDSVNVEIDKGDIISISVEDEASERAAKMANAFVQELQELIQTLAVTSASQRRQFFENQLKRVKEDLIKAEEVLQSFQEKTGAVKVDEQAKALIESISELRAQIAGKEVELDVMKTYTTLKNPDRQKAEKGLKGLKEQLRKLEAKSGNNPDSSLIPTGQIPQIAVDYIRKLREVKYQETLFELMVKQFEMANMDEARKSTAIQVIDRALPPDKPIKSKRFLLGVSAAFIGFFLAVFLAFFREYVGKISDDPKNKETIDELRKYSFSKKS